MTARLLADLIDRHSAALVLFARPGGKPFVYHVEDDGKTAVFATSPYAGMEKAAVYNLRWKVSVKAK